MNQNWFALHVRTCIRFTIYILCIFYLFLGMILKNMFEVVGMYVTFLTIRYMF